MEDQENKKETNAPDTKQEEGEKVILTERDIRIFKLIHEQRYVVHSHLRYGFWFGRSEPANACHRRKQKLRDAGYLLQSYSTVKKIHVFSLTEKSYEELRMRNLDSGLGLYKPTDGFDANIDHDLHLTNVRILLGNIGFKEWISERMLKEGSGAKKPEDRIPDGALIVNGYKIAVEFENRITKGTERYQKMFDDYAEDERFFLLLMIIHKDSPEGIMRKVLYDARKVWFVGTTELFQDRSKARVQNDRAQFTLHEILPHAR